MNKVLSTIFSAFLVLTCISPVSADDSIQEVSPTLETEEVIKEPASDTPQPVEIEVSEPPVENAETAISTQSTETDLCNISAFEIDERKDGTAPFDSNDDAGNDSSDSNGIVRTFDTVNYTLKYTTALTDSSVQGVDSGNVMIEFNLPCDPSVATFNADTMQWCLDMVTTYTYSDGTESNTWDKSKQVTNQRVTGRRFLQNTASQNVIPGTGTLSVGIDVKMAKNGEALEPSFFIWMEEQSEKIWKVIDNLRVTAVPLYDIELKRNSTVSTLGYYNLQTGQAYTKQTNADDLFGRLEAYSVALRFENTSPEKGLKGIEFPQGDITFDIKISSTKNGEEVTYTDNYKPVLWDYIMNGEAEINSALKRDMTPLGQNAAYASSWQTNVPYNKGGGLNKCYNGGNMIFEEDTVDSTLLHVTLSQYLFDTSTFQFPDRDGQQSSVSSPDFTKNIGYFSVGILQVLCQFPKEVTETENIMFKCNASNLQATTVSGKTVTEEVNISNNNSNVALSNFPKGQHDKRNFFTRETSPLAHLETPWGDGNAYAYAGSKAHILSETTYSGDSYLSATNILQKIDTKVFKITSDSYTTVCFNNKESQLGTIKMLFAAKPDKTGWTDETEMNNTREEQLIYFENINDLYNAGYTCLGYLYEVRDSQIFPQNTGGGIDIAMLVDILPDVPSGTVAWTKNDVRSWNASTKMNQSWTDVIYDENIHAYGLGDVDWKSGTFVDGYTKPTYQTYTNYEKVKYENGTIVSGHTNSWRGGNSLLIISNKVSVSVRPNDISGNSPKTVYDMDAGERTATFRITPTMTVDTQNSEINSSTIRDDVTVKVILPKELHFENADVSPVSSVQNEDGTTEIIWEFKDVSVKDGINPIVITTSIGEEGTENDVHNNQNLSVVSTITSKNDTRETTAEMGKHAETSISIIKLASSSVAKRAMNPFVERGQEFAFRLRYSNLSETNSDNARIYDIMPYVGDVIGSDFMGDYQVTSISADYTYAQKTFAGTPEPVLQISDDAQARTDEIRNTAVGTSDYASSIFEKVQHEESYENTVTWEINRKITAFLLNIGDLFGKEYIDVYVTCRPTDDNGNYLSDSSGNIQQAGNVYRNKFFQNSDNQAAVVISNTVETRVVKRNISGILWDDTNKNGIREEGEARRSNMQVSLYRTTPSDFDASKESVKEVNGLPLYKAYRTNGQEVSSATTGENGEYLFSGLEAGEYVVIASGADDYGLSKKDTGEDDTLDSEGTLNGNVSDAEWAVVNEIVLPDKENMTSAEYVSEHNDIGYIPPAKKKVSLEKKWDDGNNYDNSRPEEITVALLNSDGTEIENTFGKGDEWKTEYTTNTYYRGRENEVEFHEKKVPLYSGSVSRQEDGTYILTNTHLPSVILRTGGKGLAAIISISALFAGITILLKQRRDTSE